MKKFIPLEKRSKKEQRLYHSTKRVTNGFNTGTRSMKSAKDYKRKWRLSDYVA